MQLWIHWNKSLLPGFWTPANFWNSRDPYKCIIKQKVPKREKFNKRQTKISDDFEKRQTKMSVQFLQQLSILKKKHQERYDFWDRYVERYLKDMAGYKKALILSLIHI